MIAAWLRGAKIPLIFAAAGFLLFLLPGLLGGYGPFIDELYYTSCAARLDWGFVDHPPLAPFLLRLSQTLLGDQNLFALRFPAALAGSLVVLGTGLLSRRLGAGKPGQALACGAVLCATVFQVFFGFYSMNAFEILIWLTCAYLVVEIELRGDPRLWIAFGLVAGLGLLNKHTMVLFAGALAVALVATRARRHLGQRWLWLGLAIAAILVMPNLLWQASHDWISLEFYRNADLHKNVVTPPVQVLWQQVLFLNPGTLPIWLAGLVWLLRSGAKLGVRHLGVVCLLLLAALLIAQKSRPDRIAGMYPILFAAGGVALEQVWHRRGWRWVRWAVPVFLGAWGMALAPMGLPLLPPATMARYAAAVQNPQLERGAGKRARLPQWFADRLGWPKLVREVAAVRDGLPEADRAQVAFFAPSYGQAGALDWLGRPLGLTPVYCSHNNWFLWGPPAVSPQVAIVLGDSPEHLAELFEQVELARIHRCGYCMPWRNEMPIWIVRRPRVSLAQRWPRWRHLE